MEESPMERIKPFEVLLVENNPADVELTRMAFEDRQLPYRLEAVKDGVQALGYLRRAGQYNNAARPDLIIMDLRLPIKGGLEILAEIKGDVDLRQIPVVVLTSSRTSADIQRSYSHHANCYVVKPVDLDEYIGVVQKIEDFWFTVTKLPTL
jgi:two-component system, chemotaxis family, response regulator Rcp1